MYLLNCFPHVFFFFDNFILTNKPRPEIRIVTKKKKNRLYNSRNKKYIYIYIIDLTSNLQVYRNLILRVVSKNKYYKYGIIILYYNVVCFSKGHNILVYNI